MKTIDMFNGDEIIRPVPNPGLRYDFDVKRKGDDFWAYVNSADNIDAFTKQIKGISKQDTLEGWRIIDAKTGRPVKER